MAELELDLALDGNSGLAEDMSDVPKRMSLKLSAGPPPTANSRRGQPQPHPQDSSQHISPTKDLSNGSRMSNGVSAPPLSSSLPVPGRVDVRPPSPPVLSQHELSMMKLRWDHPIHIVGRACNNETNICPRCTRGIHTFHRLLPCNHVFCAKCSEDSQEKHICLKCFGDIASVVTMPLLAEPSHEPTVRPFSPPPVSPSLLLE
jgi:hypothetical protein